MTTTVQRKVRRAVELAGTIQLRLSPNEQEVLLQLIADTSEFRDGNELFTLLKIERKVQAAAALVNDFADTPATN